MIGVEKGYFWNKNICKLSKFLTRQECDIKWVGGNITLPWFVGKLKSQSCSIHKNIAKLVSAKHRHLPCLYKMFRNLAKFLYQDSFTSKNDDESAQNVNQKKEMGSYA